MRVVGVDPGMDGAIAAWDGKELEVWDIPKIKAKSRGYEINILLVLQLVRVKIGRKRIDAIFAEKDAGRPKEGAGSARKGGKAWGIVVGSLGMLCSLIFWPTAAEWKKEMRLNKDKEYSRTKAIETFPEFAHYFTRKKDHNRAEAALIAYHGHQKMRQRRGRPRLSDIQK